MHDAFIHLPLCGPRGREYIHLSALIRTRGRCAHCVIIKARLCDHILFICLTALVRYGTCAYGDVLLIAVFFLNGMYVYR